MAYTYGEGYNDPENQDPTGGYEPPRPITPGGYASGDTAPTGPITPPPVIPPAGTGTSPSDNPWQTNPQSWFMSLVQGKAPNIQTLLQIQPQLEERGYHLVPNATMGADGKPTNYDLRLPSGEIVDVLQGASRGGEAWQWLTGSGGGAGGPGGGAGNGAYVPGQGVPGQGTIFGAGTPGSGDARSLYDTLMQRARQSLQIDRNDPIIRNQGDAFSAEQQRGERNYEKQLAERLGGNANMGVERRIGAEKVAQSSSAYTGQLMQNELNARRQEIQQALSGASGLLTAQQQMQLQEELAQLGLAQGAYQFDVNDQWRNSPMGQG